MPRPTHHLFFSYSRNDNQPQVVGGEGWITAFYRRLQAQHKAYTRHELKIFFDTEDIDHGGDWKGRLGQGLRTSRLFLAFLSPNYMRSPNCRWEWACTRFHASSSQGRETHVSFVCDIVLYQE
jgi:hypothetical protein